jgi:hypothetical protein
MKVKIKIYLDQVLNLAGYKWIYRNYNSFKNKFNKA